MSEREELTLTELIAKSRVMHAFLPDDDDRTVNQYTADEIVAAGYQKVPEGFEWHEVRMHGYLSSGDILVIGPLFESEKAQAREYRQMLGTTPWRPVEDDDE